MTKSSWLPLTEYSLKHKVSMSTLRRRIKAGDIQYQLEDGKYLIADEPVSTHQRIHRPSLKANDSLVGTHIVEKKSKVKSEKSVEAQVEELTEPTRLPSDEPILSAAGKLLTELKKAYTLILQEKEEQILSLKEEISDLKTLVKVLESENNRLNQGTFSYHTDTDTDGIEI